MKCIADAAGIEDAGVGGKVKKYKKKAPFGASFCGILKKKKRIKRNDCRFEKKCIQ